MDFGVTMFPAEYAMDVADLGRETEARGFESLFFPEHTHIPASRKTPYPSGGPLPDEYSHNLDPFVAFGAVAAVTSKILLGTGICLIIQREPIATARVISSIDTLSKGRFLFGIGAGWNREEIENHGVEYRKRWRVMRERVQAMKTIWTNEVATFHGEYVNFDEIWQWPKPAQQPHPPVIIGGDGPLALQHLVEYGDGWVPHPNRGDSPLADRLEVANQKLAEAGRKPVPVTLFGVNQNDSELELYQKLGVARLVFRLPPKPRDDVLPVLDQYAEIMRRFS